MKTRFNPFPIVNSIYGAPMGRSGNHNSIYHDTPLEKLAVSRPQYEYDSGGVYWGTSREEGPVYAVWLRGNGSETVQYVRAHSKNQAKIKVLEEGI